MRGQGTSRWSASRRLLVGLLTVLLAGDVGFSRLALAREVEPAGGSITVLSEPAGATVYVNGQQRGTTPVALEALAPGEHRVTVEKDGYLENSRVVSVGRGQGQSVRVKLTPGASGARHATTTQVESSGGGGGGGGKKVLLIGLGAAAVGAGAYFLLRDTNEGPTVSGVTASPSTALAAVTSVSFSANATDPDGDSLTYSWNFGDGASGSGSSASHTYASAGTFNVSVTVSDGEKSASGNASVTVRSLAGTWRGTLDNFFNSTVNLAQSGTSLSGSYSDQFGSQTTGPVSGNVAAPNRVTLTIDPACCVPFTFSGTLDESLNRITGAVNGSGFSNAPWTLTRQ